MSLALHKLGESEKGFSLAEVVMAMVVFVSAVLGISSMLMSGSAAVKRGALENTATQLAQKKIEDIKTLSFYSRWTGVNQDIDDFYFNTGVAEPKNEKQLEAPKVVENYGKISGFSNYKRTTAIQYQIVKKSGTVSTMEPAVMHADWVPKNESGNSVVSPHFDLPRNLTGNKVQLLLVEVRVYYRLGDSGQQMSYAERALVSGVKNPALVVNSITPAKGLLNSKQRVDITVQSEDLALTDKVSVSLWYPGQTSIPGKLVTIESSTLISCEFDLKATPDITVRPGMYNLEVYWENKGWKDTSFRNCFTVTVPLPTFTSISPAWGYNGQSACSVVISGSDFLGATVNLERNNGTIIPATETIVSSDGTKINCNFDLRNISDTEYCDIVITTLGGVIRSDTDEKRLWVKALEITSVTPTTLYRKCSYTNAVVVTGKYFKPGLTVSLSKTNCNTITGSYATGGAVTETGDVTSFTMGFLDLRLADDTDNNRPIKAGNSTNEVGNWNLSVTNPDGQYGMMANAVTVNNAPIEISSSWSDQRCWDWDTPLTITGKYFDPSNTTVSFLDSAGNAVDPPDDVSTLTGAGTPTGSYDGSAQAISGGVLNLINVPPATYKIRVTDTENNQSADRVLVATYQAPSVPYSINPTSVTNGTTAALAVRAKGLYGSTCSYTVQYEELESNLSHYTPVPRYHLATPITSTLTWSRSEKWVQVSGDITIPSGEIYKTANGATQAILVTNTMNSSAYWMGYPTVN